jgi:hypothetical protein
VPQEAVPVVGQPEEISEIIPRFTLMLGEVKFSKIEAVEEPERASSPAIVSMASEGEGGDVKQFIVRSFCDGC